MTTPAAEAIRGLVEALRLAVDELNQAEPGWAMLTLENAMAAFEKRQPLREDAELIDAVAAKLADEFGETTWNIDPDDFAGYVRITRVLLDALDAALFGPAAKEGSR